MFGAKTFASVVLVALVSCSAFSDALTTPSPATIDPALQQEWTKTLHQVEDAITAFAKKNNLPVNEPLFPWLDPTPAPTTMAPAPTTVTPAPTTPSPTKPVATTKPPYSPRPGQGGQQGGQQGGSGGKPKCSITVNPTDEHNIKLNCPTTDRVRFIGLGDWGEDFIAPYVLGVRDGVIAQAKTNTFDFIFAVGDNFYRNGVTNTTDELWRSTWVDRWQIGTNLTLPWISFMGNHDWYGNAQAQIDYAKTQEAGAKYWIMPSKYYSIDATVPNNKQFKIAVVDTMTINTTAEFDWAAQQYSDPKAEFVLAAGHHHLYSAAKRGDNKDAPMVKLRSMIESSDKVKAYLCGHEHDMQYLRAANKDYFMFGGGGRTMNETEVGPGTAAETVYFKKKYGYATFDISVGARTMVVTYYVYNNQGQVIETPVFKRQY